MADEIVVEVELKSLLKRFATAEEGVRFSRRLQAGDDVARLLAQLEIPRKWIGLVGVNGRQARPEQVLADGDHVDVYPPFLSGG